MQSSQSIHMFGTQNLTWVPHLKQPTTSVRLRRSPPPIKAVSATTSPPQRRAHTMPPEKAEVFKSLENWATKSVLPLLKPVEQCWQPQNFVPDPALPFEEFKDQVRALRDRTAELPDEYFVVLVGDMITEEALPTYQTMINTLDGVRDESGASPDPWAVWTRAWTAEENRHGDLLKTYLYLSGRVDMLMIEKTVQYLIGAGMVSDFCSLLEQPSCALIFFFNQQKKLYIFNFSYEILTQIFSNCINIS